jgi:phospholipase C
MPDFAEHAERTALRGVAHLLPARWRQIIDLIAAPVPPTPTATIPAPSDPAARRLEAIDHIVVVMFENRSFDHMLGCLSLPPDQGGKARSDIDGLSGPSRNVNRFENRDYGIHHLDQTQFNGETEDPDHSARSVDEQLHDGGDGFVENFARISKARALKLGQPAPDLRAAELRALPRPECRALAVVLV